MLITLFVGLALATTSTDCSVVQQMAGLCTISNSGSSVDIGAIRPGDDDPWRESGGSWGGSDESGPGTVEPRPCETNMYGCGEFQVVLLRPTLEDVASFAPVALDLADEPGGVAVVGLPINFVVDAHTHSADGTLFDMPVTVRFTPHEVVFLPGDGTARTADTGGRSWASLGQAPFTATPTSHVFTQRGTFTAGARVRYIADANFGNGWLRVPGLLDIPTGTTDIQVLEARTALVERSCLEDPTGPGC